MKKFKVTTIISLSVIAILVMANIGFLYSLYQTYKERYMETVETCIRQTYILSWINVLHETYDVDNGNLTLLLTLVGDSTETEWYDYPQLDKQLTDELVNSMYVQSIYEPDMKDANYAGMDSIFRRQLSFAGILPESAFVLPADSVMAERASLWELPFHVCNEKHHLYNVYISSLGGEILKQMAGIIATSAAILMVMSFLIWYLLHWVGKLRTIEQMKDDFTHNMTHELKTPISVAYSAADSMLRYYDQSDEVRNRQFLAIILQRLNFLSGMIENILSMSMERFKTMELNLSETNLYSILTEVSNMIELKADKPVKVDIVVPVDSTISTDSLHFGNVISNILDNAVKYSGDEVEISVKGDTSQLIISDKGIGISKENLPHIFEKFYRVTDGDKYAVGGYGLGLFYVKQIVDLQGWRIFVDSKLGKGTTFTIKFKQDEEI